jgi:hypothetical protein
MMRELFIYYRIEEDGAHSALVAAQQMQRRLRERHPALTAQLMCRLDEASHRHTSDQQTWMETYSLREAGGVSIALQAEIEAEAAALAPFIAGTRHTEVFVPCAS